VFALLLQPQEPAHTMQGHDLLYHHLLLLLRLLLLLQVSLPVGLWHLLMLCLCG
jgi:hypothetical protein